MGIDGCKAGWCVVYDSSGDVVVNLCDDISQVVSIEQNPHQVLIDIPIGLPDMLHPRSVEKVARSILKKRASSIFETPCRDAVYADTYQEALSCHQQYSGKGISIQSWYICPKIREVDTFLQKQTTYVNILKESHPELCFYYLQKEPIHLDSKKSKEGLEQRLSILERWNEEVRDIYEDARSSYKKKDVQDDDIIDALCLWLVNGLSQKKRLSRLVRTEKDKLGLDMNMHYTNPYGHEL